MEHAMSGAASGLGIGAGRTARGRVGPAAVLLVLLGLAAAVATDGRLPADGTRALLGVLLVLDLVAAEWLTRPRPGAAGA